MTKTVKIAPRLPLPLVVLGLVPVLFACDSADPIQSEYENSFMEMTINGERWSASHDFVVLDRYDGIMINGMTYVDGLYPRLEVMIVAVCEDRFQEIFETWYNPMDQEFTYCELHNSLKEGDGDVLIASYFLSDNYELIFDRQDDEVWEGRFAGDYVIEERRVNRPRRLRPDTLRVRNGRFRMDLSEVRVVTTPTEPPSGQGEGR